MESPQPRKLSTYLADDVRDNADDLVETWISEITTHPSIRPTRMLPRDAIRDHIPEVIRTIAESLRTPLDAGPKDGAVRSHARLRYDQGYDIEELFIEYRPRARPSTSRFRPSRTIWRRDTWSGDRGVATTVVDPQITPTFEPTPRRST